VCRQCHERTECLIEDRVNCHRNPTEMLGVKAGLGWYLQWAQGWAAYANMYAALLIMAFLCSGLITALFRLRDRLLSWQKGLVRW
jgi:NitT/TauT family transport system permease protein